MCEVINMKISKSMFYSYANCTHLCMKRFLEWPYLRVRALELGNHLSEINILILNAGLSSLECHCL